ncbi:glycoside hydrolase family 43 protein [Enterococcus camelliae]|uniref:Glycoside hydrolase family 43 protein n=1 Tax=Enterococcus camelliae TaxID=453959 RepID=A0ABW5TGH3_9ENTE
MGKKLVNPVLRGFHPDASILKVGLDYYMATSTFEWMPGIDIYHSRDLVNWRHVASPIQTCFQLDFKGNYNSGSLWAPHLSYSEGYFWLVVTDVKTNTAFKDTLNYLFVSKDITGDWGEPLFLHASGFDPAFFHDDDGKHYLVSMLYDHRLDYERFSGLVMQEFDWHKKELVGKRQRFFKGTDLGVCEGPQLVKKDGWYYLLAAAGGTGYSHAATVSRSKYLEGPYELSPWHPFLTTKDDPDNPLQKSGHACFIEVQADEWYIAHICSRPLQKRGNCPLGRETSLQKIVWENGWPHLANGSHHPDLYVEKPSIAKQIAQKMDFSETVRFTNQDLPASFKSLRMPINRPEISLTDCPGHLRLYGRQSISSLHEQTLLARRWQHFNFIAETEMVFQPANFQQMAGLVLFYDTDNWVYLHVSFDDNQEKKYIQLEENFQNKFHYASDRIYIEKETPLILRVEVTKEVAQFSFKYPEKQSFQLVGSKLRIDGLSDDAIKSGGKLAFTGEMVGICAQDMYDHKSHADFSYFSYLEKHREKE